MGRCIRNSSLSTKNPHSYSEIFSKYQYDAVIAHHGIYSPQGIVVGLAKIYIINVVTWIKSYRKKHIIFMG